MTYRPTKIDFLVFFIASVAVLYFFVMPYLLPSALDKQVEYHSKITVPILVAVVTLVVSLFVLGPTLKSFATQTKQLEEQAENTRKQMALDQFKSAIDNLSKGNPVVVLSGIHTLHNLAMMHPNEYAEQIFHILCDFIRAETMKQKYQDSIQKVLDSEVKREWEMPIQARPLIVIQTIVNYLFRDEKSSPIYKFRANLSGAFLGGVDFYKANLPNVIFYKADLKRTSFREANLQGATLHFALMEKTNFHKADLRGASLGSAYLMETNLKDADLRGARFWVAKSDDDSIFQNVNVTGADFSGVQCQYKFYNEYRDTVQTAMKQGKGLQTNLKGMMLYDKNGNLRDSDDEETKKKWFLKERAIIDDLSAKETQKIFEKREWEY